MPSIVKSQEKWCQSLPISLIIGDKSIKNKKIAIKA